MSVPAVVDNTAPERLQELKTEPDAVLTREGAKLDFEADARRARDRHRADRLSAKPAYRASVRRSEARAEMATEEIDMRMILTLTASLLAGTAMAQGNFTATPSGGATSSAGAADAGAGVLSTDPVATTNDAGPSLGTDVVADPADAGLGPTGPVGNDSAGAVPVLNVPAELDAVNAGSGVDVNAPVLIVPAEPSAEADDEPAPELGEGVGGDVEPEMIELGEDREGATR